MPAALGNLCPNRRPDKAFTPHLRLEQMPDATLSRLIRPGGGNYCPHTSHPGLRISFISRN